MKKPLTVKSYTIITLIIVFFMISFLLSNIKNKTVPKLLAVAHARNQKVLVLIRQKVFDKKNLNHIGINDLMIINKNSKEEITYIDFNLENAYEMLFAFVEQMQSLLDEYEEGKINKPSIFDKENLEPGEDNYYILKLPFGVVSDNPFLANFGPNILVKIKMYGNVTGGLKTKITPYGINNSLIELYLTINIQEEIILPFKTNVETMEINALIASKVVEGIVPSFYNGMIEKNSSLLNIPLS